MTDLIPSEQLNPSGQEETLSSRTSDRNSIKTADLIEEIVETVANSSAIFKSQQKEDPELSLDEKRKIVNDLLLKNKSQFLSRFGKHLNLGLLKYFTGNTLDYETNFHVNKLQRFFNNKTRKIDRKNRRYEALRELIEKGDYFSETEMMRRNPLLYENLVGKYLTEDEKKARDDIDTTNITFVNLLMVGIERDGIKNLKKSQEEAEHEVQEEFDTDSEENDDDDKTNSNANEGKRNWGEMNETEADKYETEIKERRNNTRSMPVCNINNQEQSMLKQEFITAMYQSFLDGKDEGFDYSTVDDNEIYDNVGLREQDEEEKYFDSESPEDTTSDNKKIAEDESEDELDKFMRTLQVN